MKMSNDKWLPSRRSDQLAMAKVWCVELANKGSAWGVPQEKITSLASTTATAEQALAHARRLKGRLPFVAYRGRGGL